MPEWNEAPQEVISMARELINKYHPTLKEANIGFLFRDEAPVSRGKATWGKAQKVPNRLKPFMDYDFIIWIAEDQWVVLSTERRQALLDHELCHCVMDPDGPAMRKHDVEEFVEIIERHGFWTHDLFRIQEQAKGRQLRMDLPAKEGRVEAVDLKNLPADMEPA